MPCLLALGAIWGYKEFGPIFWLQMIFFDIVGRICSLAAANPRSSIGKFWVSRRGCCVRQGIAEHSLLQRCDSSARRLLSNLILPVPLFAFPIALLIPVVFTTLSGGLVARSCCNLDIDRPRDQPAGRDGGLFQFNRADHAFVLYT